MKKQKIILLLSIYLLWLGVIAGIIIACHVFFPTMSWISWMTLFFLTLVINLWISISIFKSKKWEQIAKTRWLFIVIFFPVFSFPFLYLFGFNRAKWNNKLNEKIFNIKNVKKPVLVDIQNNKNIFLSSNQFKIIENKNHTDKLIVQLIQQAKKSIVIQIDKMDKDIFINKYVPLLLDAKRNQKNLNIYILYDAQITIPFKIAKIFKKNNINLKCFKPKSIAKILFNVSMISSMLIADNDIAIVGNLIWDKQKPHDLIFHYCISGPSVLSLLKIFMCYWLTITNNKKQIELLSKFNNLCLEKNRAFPLEYEFKSQCQYCASYPHTQNIYNVILDLIHNAKKSIKILTSNFIPIKQIKSALEVALIKNVDVKIINSSYLPKNKMKISNYFCQDLIANKNLYELDRKIDCNFIIIDECIVIATPLDFNYSSLFLNQQTVIWVRDEKQYFTNKFDHLLKQSTLTKPIKFDIWNKFLIGCYNIFYPLFM